MRYALTPTNPFGQSLGLFWTGPRGWTDDLNSKHVRTYATQANAMRSVSRHMHAEQAADRLRDAAAWVRTISAVALAVEYDVEGCYSGAWEMVTCETARCDALARLQEYRASERGTMFRITSVRTLAAAQ